MGTECCCPRLSGTPITNGGDPTSRLVLYSRSRHSPNGQKGLPEGSPRDRRGDLRYKEEALKEGALKEGALKEGALKEEALKEDQDTLTNSSSF